MADDVAKDYGAQATSRIILQYRQSPKLAAFIAALLAPIQEIDDVLLAIGPLDDIDLAEGVNLTDTAALVGQLRELINGNVVNDAQLRILSKARITRNTAHATGPEILQILATVFAGAPIFLTDYGGMAIAYAIGRTVTADEAAILNGGAGGTILARPMGVQVTQSFFDAAGNYFGFQDTAGAKPFGELNLPAPPGGPFAEIF